MAAAWAACDPDVGVQAVLNHAEEMKALETSGRLPKTGVLGLKAMLLLDRDAYATAIEVRVAELAQEQAARLCALLLPSLADPDGDAAGAVCNLMYNLLRKPMLKRDLQQTSLHENGIRASLEVVFAPTERMRDAAKVMSDVALGPLFLALQDKRACRYGTVAAMASGAIHNLLNFAGHETLDAALDAGAVEALGAIAESRDPRCQQSALLGLRTIAEGCSYHRVDELRAAPPALSHMILPVILGRRPPQRDSELF